MNLLTWQTAVLVSSFTTPLRKQLPATRKNVMFSFQWQMYLVIRIHGVKHQKIYQEEN